MNCIHRGNFCQGLFQGDLVFGPDFGFRLHKLTFSYVRSRAQLAPTTDFHGFGDPLRRKLTADATKEHLLYDGCTDFHGFGNPLQRKLTADATKERLLYGGYSAANSGNSIHLRVCHDSMPLSASCTPFAPARSVHGNGSSATTWRRNSSHCALNAFS